MGTRNRGGRDPETASSPAGHRSAVGEPGSTWIAVDPAVCRGNGPVWLAALDPRLGWITAAVLAVVLGAIDERKRARWFALTLIPVSALTASAIVPFDGRYIPLLLLTGALLVALRRWVGAAVVLISRLPRPYLATVVAYLGWASDRHPVIRLGRGGPVPRRRWSQRSERRRGDADSHLFGGRPSTVLFAVDLGERVTVLLASGTGPR